MMRYQYEQTIVFFTVCLICFPITFSEPQKYITVLEYFFKIDDDDDEIFIPASLFVLAYVESNKFL